MSTKFYVTTPIYYVNDRPHIGHVYSTTVADIIARYHRMCGKDVFFLTGTDEHAAKVVDAAAARGLSPQAWADQNAAAFKETFAKLGITNNDFIRTTQPRHKDKVVEYLKPLLASGDVYRGNYEGWYDAGQEEYVPEKKAKELNFKSAINGKPLVRKSEENYFFRLSAYATPLVELLTAHPEFVQPDARRNEVLGRLREGLNDVPISRTGTDWGVGIPGDEAHKVYVWIDALINYVSGIDTPDRRGYWPADVHIIAKDILWFHAVIWPAMLMALAKHPGFEWVQLPKKVYAHSFWISEGQKMSKSLGNIIDLEKIDQYVATFSLDALRWYLASNGPLGTTDSDFAESKFIEVYNSDLANTLGNCFSRVTNMTSRYFEGKLPAKGPHVAASDDHNRDAQQAVSRYRVAMESLDLAAACDAAMELVRSVDGYIEATAPFKLAKDPAKLPEVGTILYNCAEALRIASIMLWPMMPGKIQELWSRMDCVEYITALAQNGQGSFEAWAAWGQLQPGATIVAGQPLFPRSLPPK